jgi:hypothetical protein
MSDLVLWGASGHGKVVLDSLAVPQREAGGNDMLQKPTGPQPGGAQSALRRPKRSAWLEIVL